VTGREGLRGGMVCSDLKPVSVGTREYVGNKRVPGARPRDSLAGKLDSARASVRSGGPEQNRISVLPFQGEWSAFEDFAFRYRFTSIKLDIEVKGLVSNERRAATGRKSAFSRTRACSGRRVRRLEGFERRNRANLKSRPRDVLDFRPADSAGDRQSGPGPNSGPDD